MFEGPEDKKKKALDRKDLRLVNSEVASSKLQNHKIKRLTWREGPGVSAPPRGQDKELSVNQCE